MSDMMESVRAATIEDIGIEGIKVKFDGDDEAGEKYYKCNTSIRFTVGERVMLLPISGTYIVFCKIGTPGGPIIKDEAMTQDVGVGEDGKLYTKENKYTLTVADNNNLGGVKPVSKTKAMTQDVGVDDVGRLFTKPESIKPVSKTTVMTQDVGVDTNGKLYTAPLKDADYAKGMRYNESARVTIEMDDNYNLVPSQETTSYGAGLGTASFYFKRAYIGSETAKIGSKNTSKIGFYGNIPITQQTLSTTTKNMGYTSATESNYLIVLNNIAGILKKLGMLS